MKSNNSRSIFAIIGAFGIFISAIVLGVTPSYAYAGTLENGNLAYAQSEFNKGSACDYLPGYETGYDAWHLVLTSRGATFMADPTNPKVAVNLNINFMRQDGTKFVIKSGALVQFGKGAYVYTLTKDRIRIVQGGSLATINGLDSGMRLSHTCPGSGDPTLVPTITPTPTPSPTSSTTATAIPSPTPTLSPVVTPTPTPTPTTKFAGTLENGNLALADSSFNKGEDCDYLPGYESGYDAWHLVLTTRGATFIQDPKDPKVSIDLNILFQRTDGSRYVITQGAWVQFGKGAYVYTPTSAQDKIVQSGTFAATNTISSGMRLSHTCPGTKSTGTTAIPTPTPSPVVTPTPTPTQSSTSQSIPSPSPTPVVSVTPTPVVSPTATPSPTTTPTPAVTPTPTPSPSQSISNCKLCIIRSYAKVEPRPSESPGPGYKALEPSPSPTPVVTPSPSPTLTPTPSPTQSSTPTPRPTTSPNTPTPPIVPPVVEDPKTVVFVKPDEPKIIVLPELKDIPAVNIKITEEPKYGTVEVNPDSTLTYVSNLTDPTSTVVDTFEITYTDLSGAVVVANREVVLAQDGDMPSIIQTGLAESGSTNNLLFAFIASVFVGLFAARRRRLSTTKHLAIIATALMSLALIVVPVAQPDANAACKPVKPSGKTVGRIKVGNVDMPIKSFTYPLGGVMEPQNSTLMAGLSDRHMPLSSDLGTSVLTWHKDYNGCVNKLNIMFDRKVGSTFEITDENGDVQRYQVTKKLEVKKGDYKKSWFTLVGPRQLSLFTCTGKFSNGHYEKNLVVIATKIS